VRRQAVLTVRAWPAVKPGAGLAWTELATALERGGRDASWPRELRLEALAAVPGGLASVDATVFQLLVGGLAATEPVAVRSAAVAAFLKAKLGAAQLGELADALRTVGPLELGRLLPVFDKAPGEELGQRLLAGLKASKGVSGLRPEVLRPRLAGYPESVRAGGEALLASLNADAGRQAARLDALLAEVKGQGDIRRGQAIFNSAKAACSACHAIGYLGGKVGPDLTRISEVRNERDLLEAIVYPSASFVRSYEPMILTTRGGDEHSGVLRKDGADEVVLATGPQAEVRVARADIAEMRPGTVSVMPQGLDEQLTRQELADLLAFLRNTRWGAR
jgi:putative heme-binding domain-containing protein